MLHWYIKEYNSIRYNHFDNKSKIFSASHILASSDCHEEANERYKGSTPKLLWNTNCYTIIEGICDSCEY
jgi:hypothetical protein